MITRGGPSFIPMVLSVLGPADLGADAPAWRN
jgi:hypothetical protein